MVIDTSILWIIISIVSSIIAALIGTIWSQRNGMLKDLKDAINALTHALSEQNKTNENHHEKMWVVIRETESKVSKIQGQLD